MTGHAMTIPTLATERLTLRAPRAEDFGPFKAILLSPRAELMDGATDADGAWRYFCHESAGWTLQGFGYWSVIETATGTWVGWTGIAHPVWFPEPEIGWMVSAEAEGRGIAREAARAALDWAQASGKVDSLVSYIDPPNRRSIRVAEAIGGVLDPDAAVPTEGDLVYRYEVRP